MSRLGKLVALPAGQRTLLFRAALLLMAIRVGLWVLPFATLRSVLRRLAAGESKRHSAEAPGRPALVVWAVEAVGNRLPAIGTCLTQALAAHVLLARMGQRSDLRIGVKRSADGKFAGHAWLEQDGTVLIGGSCHSSYAPMPVLHGLERRS
jgi:Transglutaminase-like superfamily